MSGEGKPKILPKPNKDVMMRIKLQNIQLVLNNLMKSLEDSQVSEVEETEPDSGNNLQLVVEELGKVQLQNRASLNSNPRSINERVVDELKQKFDESMKINNQEKEQIAEAKPKEKFLTLQAIENKENPMTSDEVNSNKKPVLKVVIESPSPPNLPPRNFPVNITEEKEQGTEEINSCSNDGNGNLRRKSTVDTAVISLETKGKDSIDSMASSAEGTHHVDLESPVATFEAPDDLINSAAPQLPLRKMSLPRIGNDSEGEELSKNADDDYYLSPRLSQSIENEIKDFEKYIETNVTLRSKRKKSMTVVQNQSTDHENCQELYSEIDECNVITDLMSTTNNIDVSTGKLPKFRLLAEKLTKTMSHHIKIMKGKHNTEEKNTRIPIYVELQLIQYLNFGEYQYVEKLEEVVFMLQEERDNIKLTNSIKNEKLEATKSGMSQKELKFMFGKCEELCNLHKHFISKKFCNNRDILDTFVTILYHIEEFQLYVVDQWERSRQKMVDDKATLLEKYNINGNLQFNFDRRVKQYLAYLEMCGKYIKGSDLLHKIQIALKKVWVQIENSRELASVFNLPSTLKGIVILVDNFEVTTNNKSVQYTVYYLPEYILLVSFMRSDNKVYNVVSHKIQNGTFSLNPMDHDKYTFRVGEVSPGSLMRIFFFRAESSVIKAKWVETLQEALIS